MDQVKETDLFIGTEAFTLHPMRWMLCRYPAVFSRFLWKVKKKTLRCHYLRIVWSHKSWWITSYES